MKKTIMLSVVYLFAQVLVSGQTPANDPHWQLQWADHFDSLDTTRWLRADYGGRVMQLYRKTNISVSNSNLVITLNNTAAYCPNPVPNTNRGVCEACEAGRRYKYTSGWVETNKYFDTQFGYIEAMIRFPYRDGKQWGFFPAFWTFIGHDEPDRSNFAEISSAYR